jgi:hypothetical protein
MPLSPGIFELKTVCDLFRKLESDLELLQRNPVDSSLLFNFFVTAEHMPEWLYRGDTNRAASLRKGHAILRVCSHIASGGKHFQVKDKRHTSVAGTNESVVLRVQPDLVARGSPIPVRYGRQFVIGIDSTEAQELGAEISAEELAQQLVDFWRKELQTISQQSCG